MQKQYLDFITAARMAVVPPKSVWWATYFFMFLVIMSFLAIFWICPILFVENGPSSILGGAAGAIDVVIKGCNSTGVLNIMRKEDKYLISLLGKCFNYFEVIRRFSGIHHCGDSVLPADDCWRIRFISALRCSNLVIFNSLFRKSKDQIKPRKDPSISAHHMQIHMETRYDLRATSRRSIRGSSIFRGK